MSEREQKIGEPLEILAWKAKSKKARREDYLGNLRGEVRPLQMMLADLLELEDGSSKF